MELSWECLRDRTEKCRMLISYPILSCGEAEKPSCGVLHFNRFSELLARKTAEGAGDISSLRTEGDGFLISDRYVSIFLRTMRFCEGTLSGLSCISYTMDLRYGIILRLCDMITREGMQNAALTGKKYHGFYLDEKGVHLYICNFIKEEALHCRVSQYGRFLQDYIFDYSYLKI